jgi:hypothetical protein
MFKCIDIYVHKNKEDIWDKAEELGLQGQAKKDFMYALTEVKLTLEVDMDTGKSEIIAVDDRLIADVDSCCAHEKRNMNGGCNSCGDPCL